METAKKIKIGVIFGGRSAEHEVSLQSAENIIDALDRQKYEISPIGILKSGDWIIDTDALAILNSKKETNAVSMETTINFLRKLDVVFPILHGTFGEDGTVQGFFETVGVPYVGCGVSASSICMDKIVQKQILRDAGLPVVEWREIRKSDFDKNPGLFSGQALELTFPVFVKPANLGSSVGISKVLNPDGLLAAFKEAFKYDEKILIEKAVPDAREIECALLGEEEVKASVLGEVVPSNEFYDYNAKYIDGKSETHIPANLPDDVCGLIRDLAVKAFKILNCSGLSRIDFLIDGKSMRVYLNEVNTLPGFTSMSMFPKLWEASGLNCNDLFDELVGLAMRRFKRKNKIKFSF